LKVYNVLHLFCFEQLARSLKSTQWRSKGGQVGARAQGRRPWERTSTLFAVILKRILSRNLDKSMLKTAYFFGKRCKKLL